MNFFFDRCVPIRIARMVAVYEAEHTVRHLDDDRRFSPTTPDADWIATLAEDDPPWVVISGDGRILKNKVERAALESAGLTFFCLAKAWMHMPFPEYAWKFVKVWPAIVESAKHSRAKLFEVSAGNALKVDAL